MPIFKSKTIRKFTSIPNTILQSDMSMDAVGTLCYILSLPDDWVIHKLQIAKRFNVGKDKMYKVFDELEENGYFLSIEKRKADGTFSYDYIVYDIPFNGEKESELQSITVSEKPQAEKPQAEKPTLQNTNIQNTNNTNNILSKSKKTTSTALNNFPSPIQTKEIQQGNTGGGGASDHKECMELYSKFFKYLTGVEPKITSADGKELKTIIQHIKRTNKSERPYEVLRGIFRRWNDLDEFTRKQTSLRQILGNYNTIVTQLTKKVEQKTNSQPKAEIGKRATEG